MNNRYIKHIKSLDKLGAPGISQNQRRIHKDERYVVLRISMSIAKSGGLK